MSLAVLHRIRAYRVLRSGFGFGGTIPERIPALLPFNPFQLLFYGCHDRTYPLCLVGEFYIFGFGVAIREWIPALFAFDPFHAFFYRFHDRTYPLCLVGEFYILGFKCFDGLASVGAFSLLAVNE